MAKSTKVVRDAKTGVVSIIDLTPAEEAEITDRKTVWGAEDALRKAHEAIQDSMKNDADVNELKNIDKARLIKKVNDAETIDDLKKIILALVKLVLVRLG